MCSKNKLLLLLLVKLRPPVSTFVLIKGFQSNEQAGPELNKLSVLTINKQNSFKFNL